MRLVSGFSNFIDGYFQTFSSMRCSVLAGEVSAFSAIFSYSSQSLTEAEKSKFSYTTYYQNR